MLVHIAAELLDRVMDRDEVARRIVDSAVAIHSATGRSHASRIESSACSGVNCNHEAHKNIFFAV